MSQQSLGCAARRRRGRPRMGARGGAAVNAGKSVENGELTLFWSRVEVPPGYLS